MSPVSDHVYARRVEFAETDMAGMVHFSVYLRYVEEAEHALWRKAGLSIAAPDAPVVFPRVTATVDYHLPLRFEDHFEVRIRIEAMSARTLTYRSELWRGDRKVATATHTAVCVSRHASPMQSVPIPDDIRGKFEVRSP